MSESAGKAVFLSYASQDAAAVQRLCEALRAAGVEVWFDQSELVGGDAWDQKIRGQIKSCALFVPVISAETQARREGYFRLEWKLAAQRTHTIADGTPFLLPVVIDPTRDGEALVPEEFRSVQWTRLAGGEPSAAFVARVKNLLGGPVPAAATSVAQVSNPPGAPMPTPRSKSAVTGWAFGGLGLVILALVAFIALRPPAKEALPAAPAKSVAEVKPTAAALPVTPPVTTPAKDAIVVTPIPAPPKDDKSIAVLPFTNMSDDKDSGFFADGVQEDILTNLALVRELRVVSRTSASQYRDTKKSIREIGRELGVAFLLEGSIRRAGGTVRVTAQLIRAANDEHVWAKSYDRELKAVFAIQSELATEIAGSLHASLSPQEKSALAQKPTDSIEAYDLFLKARAVQATSAAIGREGWGGSPLKEQEVLLQAAVTIDPEFAEAFAELGRVHAETHFSNVEHTPARAEKAWVAINRAVALNPESPEVIRNLAACHLYARGDYARATQEVERLVRMQPNNSEVYFALYEIQQREGKWLPALGNLRKATQLDPGNIRYARALVIFLRGGRRWEESRAAYQRLCELMPDSLAEMAFYHRTNFHATGSTREMAAWLASLTNEQRESAAGRFIRASWALSSGDYAEFLRIDALMKNSNAQTMLTAAAAGDRAGAVELAEKLAARTRARLEMEPENSSQWYQLGLAEAVLGHKDEALKAAQKSVQLVPEAVDAVSGPAMSNKLALVYAWAGETDKAIEIAARLLRTPFSVADVHMMRHDPWWSPLRSDPRFMALLDDPKNNAPLF